MLYLPILPFASRPRPDKLARKPMKLPRPIWTTRRKVMGNLIPALCCLPFLGSALWIYFTTGKAAWGFLAAFPISGWVALNLFGLAGNQAMRTQLARRYAAENGPLKGRFWFGGIARPGYRNVWDPHEDIALILEHDDRMEIYGEHLSANVMLRDLKKVGKKPNPHTFMLIGGWITLETDTATWLFEPRTTDFLIVNAFGARNIRKEWQLLQEKGEAPGP